MERIRPRMTKRRDQPQTRDPKRRCLLRLTISAEERATVQALADRDGLSLSNLLRRCLNNYLLDSDEAPMLPELKRGGWTIGDRVQ
jgi:hypothetical protein